MPQHGKKYQDALQARRPRPGLSPDEAVDLLKQTRRSSFDPSAEAHIRLGVDPRHADQMVRGTVVLPHGTGKTVRVVVFAQGEKAQEALRAGADEVGGDDLAKRIEAGWLDFDVALATPDMMGMVGKLGRILGRRGLMPNPKSGTITFDLERAISEVKAWPRRVQGRQGRYHPRPVRQGQLRARAAGREPGRADGRGQPRPAQAAKGQYFKNLTVASTMGPGIRVDVPGSWQGQRPDGRARWRSVTAPADRADRRTFRHRQRCVRGPAGVAPPGRSGSDGPDRNRRPDPRERGTPTGTPRQGRVTGLRPAALRMQRRDPLRGTQQQGVAGRTLHPHRERRHACQPRPSKPRSPS